MCIGKRFQGEREGERVMLGVAFDESSKSRIQHDAGGSSCETTLKRR
jgi:hypothetical protein